MIPLSAGLKATLASQAAKLCTCWKVTLTNSTVLGFTDHDLPLVIAGVTYQAATGYYRTDIAGAADLSVDNLEVQGMLKSPSITEADLHAGIWDFAAYEIFLVNWDDLSQGTLPLRSGNLGEVTVEREVFKGELRGLTQAYSRTIGELTQPGCRAELYDARCKVNPAGFTVTGTLTGVSANGLTLYDTGRAEPGPPGGVTIAQITKANPGHITLAAITNFYTGQIVMLSGIAGSSDWATLNTTTTLRNVTNSGQEFDLGISTSAFTGSYTVNSGTITPLGADSGYFDFGLITMTSGADNGLSMEVRAYVPGQWTLELPFPYLPVIGDTYSMQAGCDKSLATCISKFNNVLNFRGEPYLPGLDKIVQTGKQMP